MPDASETTPLRSSPPRNGTDPAKNGQYGAVPDQAGARAGAGAADAPEPEHPQGFKFAVIIASLWVVLFMAALDGTIVVTLISSISSSFKASEKSAGSARPICCRCAPSRRLRPHVGHHRSQRCSARGACVFHVGHVPVCGGDQHGRAAGGTLYRRDRRRRPAHHLVHLHDRSRSVAQARCLAGSDERAVRVSVRFGRTPGGFINDAFGWRTAFGFQVPFLLAGGVCIATFVNIPLPSSGQDWKQKLGRIDYLGSLG